MKPEDYENISRLDGERLKSKRNAVDLVRYEGKAYVIKHYADRAALIRETDTLKFLDAKKVPVPKVLYQTDAACILSYLPGKTYAELAEVNAPESVTALCDWFKSFNRAVKGKLRGDVNLRNFIYFERKCFSVDFEDPLTDGKPETDLGRFLAYLVTYDPVLSFAKRETARQYVNEFLRSAYCEKDILEAYQNEITAMTARRGGKFTKIEDEARSFLIK